MIAAARIAPHYCFAVGTDSASVAPGDAVTAGQLIGTRRGLGVLASVDGVVSDICPHPDLSGREVPHVFVTPAGDRLTPPASTPAPANTEALIERCQATGLIGMGGAGFPVHRKLAAAVAGDVHTLIVNVMQSERANDADLALLNDRPDAVWSAVVELAALLGVGRSVVALPETAAGSMTYTSSAPAGAEFALLPDGPAAGAERHLTDKLCGINLAPGAWPVDAGVLCMNLASCHAVGQLLRGVPPVERVVTVCGVNQIVRFGHPVAALIGDAGDCCVYHGGHSGFRVDQRVAVTAATTSIEVERPQPATPCIRCNRCADVCPEGLAPQEMWFYGAAGRWRDLGASALEACVVCGACDHACPSHLPLVRTFRDGKAFFDEQAVAEGRADAARARFERRERRLQRDADARTARRAARLANRRAAVAGKRSS